MNSKSDTLGEGARVSAFETKTLEMAIKTTTRTRPLKHKQNAHFASIALIVSLLFDFIVSNGQSVLLTDLYGRKLSELTNFENRYLLIPHEGIGAKTLDSDSDSKPKDGQPVGQTQADSSNLLPEALALQASQPAPPVQQSQSANIWRPLGQQSGERRLLNITNQQPNQQQQQQQLVQDQNKALMANAIPGEPNVLESVVTEFPNPNINNLGHEITKILKKFFVYGYDKRVRPNYSGPPALVNVSFHIIGISSVDEVQMDFTTDFYFRQKWYDPRLEFDPVGQVDELCVGAEFAEKIWLPDTFFANEKTATFHKATTENTFIRIMHTGGVYRSIRLTVTCSCPMDLQYFPMDRQRCKIEIESYGYNTRDINYRWEKGDNSVSLETKIELPQFKILGFRMGQELQNLSSGDYIRLYCEIHFVRSMGYYLIQIYIPASLIVMISWVSFWLHRNATPARVALGVTTVLTMTTLMSSTNAALPKISYIKSIDVFLGTCFVMVFASLLEYASVGYIGKRIAMKRKRLQELQMMQQHHQKVCVAAAASAAAAANSADHHNIHHHHQQTFGQSQQISGILSQAKGSNFGLGANNPQTKGKSSDGDSNAGCVGSSQTLQRRATTAGPSASTASKTLGRIRMSTHGPDLVANGSDYGQRSAIKVVLENNPSGPKGHYFHDSSVAQDGPNGTTGFANIKRRIVNPVGVVVPTPPELPIAGNLSASHPNGQADGRNRQTILLPALPLTANGQPVTPSAGAVAALNSTAEFEVSQTHDMIRICGLTPSSIDKHSRVVFPICFVCFNLMYWIIYGHISQQVEDKGSPLIPFIKS